MDVAKMDECRGHCCTCPVGTDCLDSTMLPITLEDLPITPGYYRLNSRSLDVRRCPDSSANCPLGQSVCLETTSGCQGGRNQETICRPGLNGTFCRGCVEPKAFYVGAARGVNATCRLCGESVQNAFASLTSTLGIVLLGVVCLLIIAGCLLARSLLIAEPEDINIKEWSSWQQWKRKLKSFLYALVQSYTVPNKLCACGRPRSVHVPL